MLKTPLCDLLGIEKPVFQGGMAWIADASLASAVSEAGGLGIIAAMNADANWLRDQIHELRAKTDKPFGVNVMLMSPFADEVAQVVIDERVPVVVTGAGQSRQVHEGVERGGHQGHPGRCLGGAGAPRDTSWSHGGCCRGYRIGRPYWRDLDDGTGAAGRRCG